MIPASAGPILGPRSAASLLPICPGHGSSTSMCRWGCSAWCWQRALFDQLRMPADGSTCSASSCSGTALSTLMFGLELGSRGVGSGRLTPH